MDTEPRLLGFDEAAAERTLSPPGLGRRLLLGAWVLAVLLAPALGRAQAAMPTITISDLGTLGGIYGHAYGINDTGQVVGRSSTASGSWYVQHAFLWQNGSMTDLGTLGGLQSVATDINNAGQVVGSSYYTASDSYYDQHAFLWQNGSMTDLGTLGGSFSEASGINENGQVVGSSYRASDPGIRAFLWQNGTIIDLGTLGGFMSVATDINNAGQVVGWSEKADRHRHAFLWQNGSMTDLGTLGGTESFAESINDAGQVVGRSNTMSGESHAVLWQSGSITDIGTPGVSQSVATDINDAGQIVGTNYIEGCCHSAWLWQNGSLTKFGTLGGSDSYVNAINEQGQAVGRSETVDFQSHTALWHVSLDTTPPVFSLTTPTDGATYLLNQVVLADYRCDDEAAGSGVATCVGTVADGAVLDTSSVGTRTFTVETTDNASNPASESVSYTVAYGFSGFSEPVDMTLPNRAKAGQAIPLKWRVTDANAAPITTLSQVQVSVASLRCAFDETPHAVDEYVTGESGLQNLGDGYYQFNWKTSKSYADSCKTLRLDLSDGVFHTAEFLFTN